MEKNLQAKIGWLIIGIVVSLVSLGICTFSNFDFTSFMMLYTAIIIFSFFILILLIGILYMFHNQDTAYDSKQWLSRIYNMIFFTLPFYLLLFLFA